MRNKILIILYILAALPILYAYSHMTETRNWYLDAVNNTCGTEYGCGFSTIALGDGVIDIKGVCDVIRDADIPSSTLEIVGSEDILKKSVTYLKSCGM